MMIKKRLTDSVRFAALASWLALTAQADETVEQDFIEKLDALTSFQASFQQQVIESDGYVLDETEGVMSFERPSKLYWHVSEPFPSTLVSDSEKLYFYDPDLNQVTVRNWSSDPRENPVAVFVSNSAVADYYEIAKIDVSESGSDGIDSNEAGTYRLTPKLDQGSYSELQIVFNSTGIESMKVLDSLGQTTSVQFAALQEEETALLPESPYQFVVPENAELIFDE